MSKYGLIVNVDNCIGCQACFVACKQENQVAPNIQWNQIHRNENAEARVINYFRLSCQHCENPACLPICPMKAIYKAPNGEILVDQDKCIGCQMCARACPYGAPQFNTAKRTSYYDMPELAKAPAQSHHARTPGKAERCTLCTHRTALGELPACVVACSVHALTFVDYDNPTEEQKVLIEKAKALNASAKTEPKVRYIASYMEIETCKDKVVTPA